MLLCARDLLQVRTGSCVPCIAEVLKWPSNSACAWWLCPLHHWCSRRLSRLAVVPLASQGVLERPATFSGCVPCILGAREAGHSRHHVRYGGSECSDEIWPTTATRGFINNLDSLWPETWRDGLLRSYYGLGTHASNSKAPTLLKAAIVVHMY